MTDWASILRELTPLVTAVGVIFVGYLAYKTRTAVSAVKDDVAGDRVDFSSTTPPPSATAHNALLLLGVG